MELRKKVLAWWIATLSVAALCCDAASAQMSLPPISTGGGAVISSSSDLLQTIPGATQAVTQPTGTHTAFNVLQILGALPFQRFGTVLDARTGGITANGKFFQIGNGRPSDFSRAIMAQNVDNVYYIFPSMNGGDLGAAFNAIASNSAGCNNACSIIATPGTYSGSTSANIPLISGGKLTFRMDRGAVWTYTGSSYAINTVEMERVGSNSGVLIDGGSLIGTSAGMGGLHLLPTDGIQVQHMSITGFSAGIGVLNEGAEVTSLTNNFISQNFIGVELITTICRTTSPYTCSPSKRSGRGYTKYSSNAMHAINNIIAANKNHNVFDEGTTVGGAYGVGSNNQFRNNDFEGGNGTAVEIDGTNDTVSGNYFEATPHFIVLGNLGISADGTQIRDNHFSTPNSTGSTVEAVSASTTVVEGNSELGRANTCFFNYTTSNYDYVVGNTITSANQFCHRGRAIGTLTNGIFQTKGSGTFTAASLVATSSLSTPSLKVNGSTAISSVSSANSQMVTVAPGTRVSGSSTLASGTVTVSTSAACTPSASCVYKLTRCGSGASTAIGDLNVSTETAGTSFTINALTATNTVATGDVSKVCWQIN